MSLLARQGLQLLTVVLCRQVFEGREAVVARHVLLKLLLERLETDAVLLVGAELGDVEAGRVWHMDHVGVGQHCELVFLRDKDRAVRGIPASHKAPPQPNVLQRRMARFVLRNNKPVRDLKQAAFVFSGSFFLVF